MLLTELLFKRIKELGLQGVLALRPGFVALVSPSSNVKTALVAALYPGQDDQRSLSEGTGAAPRFGVGLLGRDGHSYRLIRELGAARTLQKLDPATKKYAVLTEDDLEISSFLRVESEMPGPESYAGFFVLEKHELPSQRRGSSGAAAVVDQEKVRALKAELEQTKDFETAQDKLYKVQTRLHELNLVGDKVDAARRELEEFEARVSQTPFTPAQFKDLTARARRWAQDQKKQAETLADLRDQADEIEADLPPTPAPLVMDPLLWGGIAGGLAIDGLSVLVQHPTIALISLVPFAAALVAALRWIDAHEAEEGAEAQLKRFKEREEQLKKLYADEQATLNAALKAAKVASPEALLDLFETRAEQLKLRDQAKARLDVLLQKPELAEVNAERPALIEEKQVLELTVSSQGFARTVAEIENDLKRELGLLAPEPAKDKKGVADEGADARRLIDRACELLGTTAQELWPQLGPRLSAYLAALTDKKLVSALPDASGALMLQTAEGRAGPYATVPQPLRDQAYLALRLCLLERVVAVKKMPVFVDDALAALDPPRRALAGKMLKALAAQTQVLVRLPEAPPPGLFDHVIAVP